MGKTRLEIIEKYLIPTDVDSGDLTFTPIPTKDIRYEMVNETVFFFGVGDNHNTRYGSKTGYLVGLTGTIDLTGGASGSVDGITVNSVQIMSGAIANAVMSNVAANTFSDGTVTLATVTAADTVTVNELVYTAVTGIKTDFTEFTMSGTNTVDAADLAHSINNDTRNGTSGDISATSNLAVVTATTDVTGTSGNAITLVSSTGARLAVSGAGTFTGGVTAETITVNGLAYTAITGAPSDFTEFSIDTSDDATATSLATAITGDTRAGTLNDVTAIATTDTVNMTQTVSGAGGKATTLAETGSGITISGSTFDSAEDFDTDLTDTATNVAANITAHISTPNYSATSSGTLITFKIESDNTAVDGLTVEATSVTITTTDVDMGVDAGNIEKSTGTLFVSLDELITFLRASTGA